MTASEAVLLKGEYILIYSLSTFDTFGTLNTLRLRPVWRLPENVSRSYQGDNRFVRRVNA